MMISLERRPRKNSVASQNTHLFIKGIKAEKVTVDGMTSFAVGIKLTEVARFSEIIFTIFFYINVRQYLSYINVCRKFDA